MPGPYELGGLTGPVSNYVDQHGNKDGYVCRLPFRAGEHEGFNNVIDNKVPLNAQMPWGTATQRQRSLEREQDTKVRRTLEMWKRPIALTSVVARFVSKKEGFMSKRIAAALAIVTAILIVGALPAAAGRGTEAAYFDGKIVHFQLPSSESANSNDLVIGCYQAGPDLSRASRPAPARFYALFVPGVTQHSCPDGTQAHDHVLSAVPGTPGYTGAWTLIIVSPGPNFDIADMPYTSVAAIQAGVAAGKLVLADSGLQLLAPVVN